MRCKNIFAWSLLLLFLFNWQPLFSNQSGSGLDLPEVIVIGEDSARLEGFRDFGLLPKLAPGIKLEPVADNLMLDTGDVGSSPEWKSAQAQAPGCAYRNSLTASLARGFGGAESYYRSGRQKYIEGLLLESREYFRTGLTKFKESALIPDFNYWLGEIAFRREQYQVARDRFMVVTKSPNNKFYHFSCYSIAWLDYREKNYDGAIKWFAIAAKSRERRLAAAALFWESEALSQNSDRQAESSILLKLITNYPESAPYRAALYRLAALSFNQRDYKSSLNYLEKMPKPAVGSDMLQRQAELAQGWCGYFLQDYQKSENIFKKTRSEIPGVDDVVPLAFLGEILTQLKQKKLDEARINFNNRPERLSQAPVAAAALRELAAAFSEDGDSLTAVKLNEELVGNFPGALLQADDFRRLARLEASLSETEKAQQTLDAGIAVFRDEGEGSGGSDDGQLILRLEKAQIFYSAAKFEDALPILEALFSEKWMVKDRARRSQIYLLLAQSLNQVGEYERALNVLEQIPADFKLERQAELLYERGWAALQSGKFELAASDFSVYLEMPGRDESTLQRRQNAEINLAEALFNLHQDQKTALLLTQFMADWPQSKFIPRVCNYQGLLALRRGDFEAAEVIFADLAGKLEDLDSSLAAEVVFNHGEALFSLEKYRAAVAEYEKIVTEFPTLKLGGQALIRIGESYFNQGKYLKSQLSYLKAKQLWPNGEIDEKACYGLLLLAYNQDKFNYLEVEVKNFIDRFPDSSYTVPLLLLLTDIYQRQGREIDLLALLKELETGAYADDLQLEALYRHFKLDLEKGRQPEALTDCQNLLQRFPASKYECDCRLYLARVAFDKRNYKESLDILNELADTDCPDHDIGRKVALLSARACKQLQDFENARKFYLKVIERKTQNDVQSFLAFDGLGDIFLQSKKFDEALFYYDKAMSNPDKAAAAGSALKRAAALKQAGRIDAARKSYLRLTYLYPARNRIVVEALLEALNLAKEAKDDEMSKNLIKKLNSKKLDKTQRRRFEKITAL